MAHNSSTRADLAAWASGAVTQAEFYKLDTQAFQSINGDLGGVWAPSSVIEIGGSGLYMSGDFEAEVVVVNDTADFFGVVEFHETVEHHDPVTFIALLDAQGDVTLGNSSSDDLTVEATAIFEAHTRFNDNTDFYDNVVIHSGATLSVYDDAIIGLTSADLLTVEASLRVNSNSDFYDDLEVHSGAVFRAFDDVYIGTNGSDSFFVESSTEFNGHTEFNGVLECQNTAEFHDTVTLLDTVTLHTRLAYAGIGRVSPRLMTLSDANVTVGIEDGNTFYAETLSTGRQALIDDTDAENGDEMLFINAENSFPLGVAPPVGTVISITAIGATEPGWVRMMRIGGLWVPIGKSTA